MPLTCFQHFDKALAKRDWTYSVGDEVFREGERVLDADELPAILPEMTLDELTSYQDDWYDKSRVVKKKATKKVAKKKGQGAGH
jgi:hypothetical protein